MIILPAIDLKNGSVVRLRRGDFDTAHRVADDPLAVAADFSAAGVRYVHMVDLDGARDGRRRNENVITAVAETGLRVELGGGLRSMKDLEAIFDAGVYRAVIGSAAVSDPGFAAEAVARYGEDRIAVGVDVQGERVRVCGWKRDSGISYLEFSREMERIGVKNIIFTDIDTDGMMSGPSVQRLAELRRVVSCRITASGGVAGNRDILTLRELGMYGAIIGQAYYAGAIDLARAVRDGGAQC